MRYLFFQALIVLSFTSRLWAGPPVSDEFNGASLDTSLWTAILSGGSSSMSGTQLRLTAPAGSNHDPAFGGVHNSVRVLQTVTDGDFTLEVKFDSVPILSSASNYIGQGIVVQQDAANYFRFEFGANNGLTTIMNAKIIAGTESGLTSVPISTAGVSSLWMRVQKSGNIWTQSWSSNGTSYTNMASITQAWSVTGVGVYGNNYGSPSSAAPAYTAVVDYFRNIGGPDLTITKWHSGNFAQGSTGSYTITASNAGNAATSGTVTVADTLPTGLTPTAASGSGWSCGIATQTMTCTRSDALAVGANYPAITLSVSVASNAASVTNVATVSGGNQSNTANDSASDPTTVVSTAGPDLTIAKTHSGNFVQGSTGSYTITASNTVGTTATSGTVTVADTLPPGLTPTTASGSGWSCGIAAQTMTCTRSDALAAGASYPAITLNVSVASNASSVTNVATVSGGNQTNTTNDSASDPTTVTAPAGPPVSDEFNGASLDTSLWTSTLNGGSTSMSGTQLRLTAPAGSNHDPSFGGANNSVRVLQNVSNGDFTLEVKFDSVPVLGGASTYIGQGIVVQEDAANYFRFEFGANNGVTTVVNTRIIAGTQGSLTSVPISTTGVSSLWMRVQRAGSVWTQSWSTNGTSYTNMASITQAWSVAAVGVYGNNYGSPSSAAPAYTAVVDYFRNIGGPDLTITKTHSGSFVQGGTGSYTITASNAGTAATNGTVTVADTLPTGLTPTAASGSGWNCGIATQTATCTRTDVLASGASYPTITLSVSVASNAASVTNVATVSGGNQTNTANDSASDPTTIVSAAGPDLTITKTHSGNFAQGSTGSYTITASNAGNAATSGTVTVADTLPAGLTPTAASGSGWSCGIATQTMTCTRSNALAAGASYPAITLSVSVASNASSVTNVATVSGGNQTNTTNDSASDPTTVTVSANPPVSDDFNGASLNTSLWTTTLSGGSSSMSGTQLRLTAPAGSNHDPSLGGANSSVRVLQTVSNGDFTLEVKFDSVPVLGGASTYIGQGIVVQEDAANYFRFEFGANNGVTTVVNTRIIAGTQGSLTSVPISTTGVSSLWMRVQKAGNIWTQSWSTNGTSFTNMASITQAWTVSAVGVYGNNYGSPSSAAPAYTAVVDYFHNGALPDLTISKSHSGNFVQGSTGSYTIIASNAGTAPTSGTVTVADTLPAGLTPTAASGSGWSCGIATQTATCTRSDALAVGANYPAITLNVNVASNAASVTNVATVSGGNQSNTANDSASDPTTVGTTSGVVISDDFTSSTLNGAWTFVNPLNDGSFSFNGSSILLSVPGGTSHDPWTPGDNAVRIMQPIANSDFAVEVKFSSAVNINAPYQEQGIIVEQDATHFLRFSMHSNNLQVYAFAANISGSTGNVFVNQEMRGGSATLMRLRRTGNTWAFSYSYDSYHWTPAFVVTQPFQAAKIGPYVGNAPYNGQAPPAFTAVVDHFVNLTSPPSLIDGSSYPPAPAQPTLEIWYGDSQTFGQPGVSQQWINILGNVSDFNEIASLTYSLNGGPSQPLSMGEDTFRLVDAGDFNVEIDYASLTPGNNTVVITATDTQGLTTIHGVAVNYVAGQTWPSSYSITSWPTNLQSAGQIVDGLWQRQPDGTVRTIQQGYDRVIAIGDRSTWKNYLVTAELTMNWLDPWAYQVGIVVGWQGHTAVQYGQTLSIQPRIGHPFPAFLSWGNVLGPPELYIWTNTATVVEGQLARKTRTLQTGVKYIFKCRVQQNTSGGSLFSFKVWPASSTEPAAWDLQANGELSQGSILLGAYRADVTFGQITITGL